MGQLSYTVHNNPNRIMLSMSMRKPFNKVYIYYLVLLSRDINF